MQTQKQQGHEASAARQDECPDGRCPVGIDEVKKIGLTPQEKRAIFFSIKRKIFEKKLRKIKIPEFPSESI